MRKWKPYAIKLHVINSILPSTCKTVVDFSCFKCKPSYAGKIVLNFSEFLWKFQMVFVYSDDFETQFTDSDFGHL